VSDARLGLRDFRWEGPYVFRDQLDFTIVVEGLAGSPAQGSFLRLDLYPRARPLTNVRHYGFWDIPLRSLREGVNSGCLNLASGALSVGRPTSWARTVPGWRGEFDESGYCLLHCSVWDGAATPPAMLTVRSYPLIRSGTPLDVPLKQIHIPVTEMCNLSCLTP